MWMCGWWKTTVCSMIVECRWWRLESFEVVTIVMVHSFSVFWVLVLSTNLIMDNWGFSNKTKTSNEKRTQNDGLDDNINKLKIPILVHTLWKKQPTKFSQDDESSPMPQFCSIHQFRRKTKTSPKVQTPAIRLGNEWDPQAEIDGQSCADWNTLCWDTVSWCSSGSGVVSRYVRSTCMCVYVCVDRSISFCLFDLGLTWIRMRIQNVLVDLDELKFWINKTCTLRILNSYEYQFMHYIALLTQYKQSNKPCNKQYDHHSPTYPAWT